MQFWLGMTIYYVIINLLALSLYGVDKSRARGGKWRITEHTLVMVAILGGGLGALMGMKLFHHKTRKSKFRFWVPAALIIHIVAICFFTWQNNHVVVTKYSYEGGIDCRIVQISDVHNAQIFWSESRLADMVAEQEPDIIVITGDLMDSTHGSMASAVRTAEHLAQVADTYYVTGNHEWRLSSEEREELMQNLTDAGVHVLNNESVILQDRNGREFALLGLDDHNMEDANVFLLMRQVPEGMPSILLAHEPQYIDWYSKAGVDLALSGHYHGGQFILPGVGPVVSPEFEFFPDYAYGQRQVGDTVQITSRGIGNSVIPWRLNNYPEIVVVEVN